MDNNEAKLILSVYRANGTDAQDPLFRDALKQAESDPALRAWLAEQQRFDAQVASAFASVKGPVEGRAMVETTMRATRSRRSRWLWPLALAASIALLLVLQTGWPNRGGLALPENASLGDLAVNLSTHHLSMGLMSPDLGKLRTWIAEKGGPLPERLPPGLEKMGVLGCQTWKTSRGNVSLICFVGENMKMAHLYVFEQLPAGLDGKNLPSLAQPRLERTGEWSLALWQDQGRAYVLGLPLESGKAPDIAAIFRA
jgi:hypothetical protein